MRSTKTQNGHTKANLSFGGTVKATEPRRKSTGGFGSYKGRENTTTPNPQMMHKHNESVKNLNGFTGDRMTNLEMPIFTKDSHSSKSTARMA